MQKIRVRVDGRSHPPEVTDVSDYVHENARTYWKFERYARNGMSLM